jgi:hypothetical protein
VLVLANRATYVENKIISVSVDEDYAIPDTACMGVIRNYKFEEGGGTFSPHIHKSAHLNILEVFSCILMHCL